MAKWAFHEDPETVNRYFSDEADPPAWIQALGDWLDKEIENVELMLHLKFLAFTPLYQILMEMRKTYHEVRRIQTANEVVRRTDDLDNE